MRKDFMRSSGLALILVLALASAVASAKPATTGKVIADIPFEFSVGYKTMPAGEYSVWEIPNGNGLLIQSSDGKTSALRLSNAVESRKTQSHARLVFHRYGERYFLAEVWNGADQTGRELVRSQDERNIAGELASNAAKGESTQSTYETVEVIATLR
ncbi:MAG TPA: hypothetical protein VLL54_22185 [Pyrinomonadaceae bacterium]|nr:hypothetical protein [Pyrinomonadaceae bacterium]